MLSFSLKIILSQEKGSPEELYTKLLHVISEGDDVKQVSHLLCAGTPLELVGDFPDSALQQAIVNDRSRIVNLMLASQASLIPCTQGLNLLQHAWYSPNTTAKVYCAITEVNSTTTVLSGRNLCHTKFMLCNCAQFVIQFGTSKYSTLLRPSPGS